MATKVKSCKLKFKHGEETCCVDHPMRQCVKASLGNHYGKKAIDDEFAGYKKSFQFLIHFSFKYIIP